MSDAVKTTTLVSGGVPERLIGPAAVIGFLVLWEVLPRLGIVNEFFTSRPSVIVFAMAAVWGSADFWSDAALTLAEFAAGFCLAILISVPAGFLLGTSRLAREIASAPLMALYIAPSMILLPLLILWLGIGIASKITVVFLGAIFPIIINIIAGMDEVDQRLIRMGRIFGARRLDLFRHVYLPSTVPHLLTGIRLAIGRALLSVVAAEIYVSQAGLGYRIAMFGNAMRIDRLLVYALSVSLAGYAMTRAVIALENRSRDWRRP